MELQLEQEECVHRSGVTAIGRFHYVYNYMY